MNGSNERIEWLTKEVTFHGRRGYLGSIRAFDLWQARESPAKALAVISTVASISYGLEAAKNPASLVKRLLEAKPVPHGGPFEFVPWLNQLRPNSLSWKALPAQSLRQWLTGGVHKGRVLTFDELLKVALNAEWFNEMQAEFGRTHAPAIGLLVETPILSIRQWFRHRSFAYNEMSRRFVADSKRPFQFYGQDAGDWVEKLYYKLVMVMYRRLIRKGEPPELARRVTPVGAFSTFFVGGFVSDWLDHWTPQRADDHAQLEIRQMAVYIKMLMEMQERSEVKVHGLESPGAARG